MLLFLSGLHMLILIALFLDHFWVHLRGTWGHVFVHYRLLPDQTVFSSMLWLLQSVQEQGSCAVPRFVLRSALYLLAVTQDKSLTLDRVTCIKKKKVGFYWLKKCIKLCFHFKPSIIIVVK